MPNRSWSTKHQNQAIFQHQLLILKSNFAWGRPYSLGAHLSRVYPNVGQGYPNLDGVIQIWMGLSKYGWGYPYLVAVIHIFMGLSKSRQGYPNSRSYPNFKGVIQNLIGLPCSNRDIQIPTGLSKFQLGYPNSDLVIQIDWRGTRL